MLTYTLYSVAHNKTHYVEAVGITISPELFRFLGEDGTAIAYYPVSQWTITSVVKVCAQKNQ